MHQSKAHQPTIHQLAIHQPKVTMRYQSSRPKRQFLAGVVCPACQQIDSTVYIQCFDPIDEYIECIHCGKTDKRPTPDELSAMHSTHKLSVVQLK